MGFTTGTGTYTSLDHPLVRSLWGAQMHVEQLFQLIFTLMGMTGPEQGGEDTFVRGADTPPLFIKEEFGKDRGQEIILALRKQLADTPKANSSGQGTVDKHRGVYTLLDNEEQLDLYDMSIIVNTLKHAVGWDTPELQDLRTLFRMDRLASEALHDWMLDQLETMVMDGLINGQAYHVVADTYASNVAHAYSVYANNAGSSEALNSDCTLGLDEVQRAYALAAHYKFNPIRVQGWEGYLFMVPVWCMNNLLNDETARTTLERAHPRSPDHPLFNRAAFVLDKMIIMQYDRCQHPSDVEESGNKWICPVLGGGAAGIGYGSMVKLVMRDETEYQDRRGIAIRRVTGAGRCQWANAGNTETIQQSSLLYEIFGEVQT